MNWNNIRFNTSEAFKLLLDKNHWILQGDELCYTHEIDSFISIRDLYDFFDEQGIIVSVFGWHTFGIRILDGSIGYSDSETNMILFETKDNDDFKTRIEAETKAFEKAFEILEGKE